MGNVCVTVRGPGLDCHTRAHDPNTGKKPVKPVIESKAFNKG